MTGFNPNTSKDNSTAVQEVAVTMCVVAVPIIDGGPSYLGWILEQTEQCA